MKARTTPADAVFFLYCLLLLLAVLPLGSNRPWSASLAALLFGITALGWGIAVLRDAETPGVSLSRLRLPITLYSAALVWACLQTMPGLPTPWTHPLWQSAEVVLGPLPHRIALAPTRALEGILQIAAVGMVFWLGLQMGRSTQWAQALTDTLALGLGAIAAYGLIIYASGNGHLFWYAKWAYQDDLTAVLVNRNHYAAVAGIGLLCSLAAMLGRLNAYGHRETLRQLLSGHDLRLLGLIASLVLNLFALLFTHSRAGVAVTLLGILTFLLLSGRRNWRRLAPWLALGGSIVLILFVEINDRLPALLIDADTRMQVWSLSWDLLRQRPWLGIGLGGFSDAFQAIRPVSVTQFWNYAHNTWLETLIELGIPASLCLFTAIFWGWGRCLYGALKRRRNRGIPALAAAVGVLVGSHALVDFSVQIPAIGFLTAALLGIGVAQSWPSGLGRFVR